MSGAGSMRVVLAVLTLIVALALAVVSVPGVFNGSAGVSRQAMFDELQSRFRDYSTFERDIRLMEERIAVDGRYLTAIEQLLGAPEGGMAPALELFASIERDGDLRRGCRPADPWSAPVSSERRDIDTSADGSMRVSLDLYFCLYDVPRYESGLVRYPVATVTLAAAESRQTSAVRAHIPAADRDQSLRWLRAVITGEVGHLYRMQSERKAATELLSAQIGRLLQPDNPAGPGDMVAAPIRAGLLLALLALAAALAVLTIANRRPVGH